MNHSFTTSLIAPDYRSKCPITRDCIQDVLDYINGDESETKICAIYGLRRTGKTTLMDQAIERLTDEQKKKSIRIDCTTKADFEDIIDFVNMKIDDGYKYFFIDEITYAANFQSLATIMSDIWVARKNVKVIVTGTDSLGLSLVKSDNMYDRIKEIRTTYTSFGEYSRLVGVNSIDEYIKYGSTLEKSVFGSVEKNGKYIQTAVVNNIISSLKKNEGMHRYPPLLTELYSADAIANEIQRIINRYNQSITVRAITSQFSSDPISRARTNIINNYDDGIKIVSKLKKDEINSKIAALLGCAQPSGIEDKDISAIYELLKDIGVFLDIPVYKSYEENMLDRNLSFVSHPGMFHANLKYTFDELKRDASWIDASMEERNLIIDKAYEAAMGNIMENIVISDLYHLLDKDRWYVSKLTVQVGEKRHEADVIVMDRINNDVSIFEVKHSNKNVPEQSIHLEDRDFVDYLEHNFGNVKNRIVLYNGETDCTSNIPRVSASQFLGALYYDTRDLDFDFKITIEKILKKGDASISIRSKNLNNDTPINFITNERNKRTRSSINRNGIEPR